MSEPSLVKPMSFERTTSDNVNLEQLTSPIWIRLLGTFRVFRADQTSSIGVGAKAEALLSTLALHYDESVSRDTLLTLLWPMQELDLAMQSLNSLLHSLRRKLEPALNGMNPLLYWGGGYRLNLEAGIGIDIACFDRLARQGDQYLHRGQCYDAIAAYQQAATLYRGDLSSVTDVYATLERERVRARYLTVLARIADYHFKQADYGACLEYTRRLLASDPCREDAHRLLMRCYVHLGQRAEALRHYQLCVSTLQAEFAIAPEPATVDLYEQIRQAPGSV